MLSAIKSLNESVTVQGGDAYGDGTVWFSIQDSTGRVAHVCIDGREGSETRFRLFDRARHPKAADAVLIDLGAPEEGTVVSLVSTWLESGTPKELGLTEYGWDLIRGTLYRIGESQL